MKTEESKFTDVQLEDYKVISSNVGTVGYKFSDETVQIFWGCFQSFMSNPMYVEKTMEEFEEFVKSYM